MSQGASLRDQQAEFTKRLLLEAARKVIAENEPEDFTMQKVAEEAGVSHRTVYRYFPSRQSLLDDFADFLATEFESKREVDLSFENIDALVREVFTRFEAHAPYYEAAARISGGNLRPKNQAKRTALLREEFDRTFPKLDPIAAEKAFAVIRYLIGLQTWYSLRQRFKFKEGDAADAVGWAVTVLMQALHDGNIPSSDRSSSEGSSE